MSMIEIQNLTFGYDGVYSNVFENINLRLDTSWKLGLVGKNGSGKTTLLKLLYGDHRYSGHIYCLKQFEYFPYPIAYTSGQLTMDVINSIMPDIETWRIKREITLLELDENVLWQPYNTLSGGQQTKLMIALLFLKENHFLLLDEPTIHLDMYARDILAKYLNKKEGFILVSHDRTVLDNCTDHTLSIQNSGLYLTHGNFSVYWQNYKNQELFEIKQNQKLQKDIDRLTIASRRTSTWSDKLEKTKKGQDQPVDRGYIGHKSAKLQKRAKSIEKNVQNAIKQKAELLKDTQQNYKLKLNPILVKDNILIQIKDLTILYNDKPANKKLSLEIKAGDKIALCGKNGCGKSSILKLINGQKIDYCGTFYKKNGILISYVSQDTHGIYGSYENFAINEGIDLTQFLTILRKLGFRREQFEYPIESLSAGQKKKVMISKSLCQRAHLYIWDEPLSFVDLDCRLQLIDLINEYNPTLLLVEHDRSFCNAITTNLVYMD